MSGCASMKTTQLACSPSIAPAMQRNMAPLHCNGRHTHATLIGGRDEATGEFPTRSTATYTPDTCERLADAFVRSSPSLAANISADEIPLPSRAHTRAARASPAANVVDQAPLPATATPVAFSGTASPIDDWALALGLEPGPRPTRGVTATFAHLIAAREDKLADLEQELDTDPALAHTVDAAGFIPAHLSHLSTAQQSLMLSELRGIGVSNQRVVLNALASVSAEILRLTNYVPNSTAPRLP